jgi:hypothetical protein
VGENDYCDGVPDCLDGSDEPDSCPPVSCQPTQFQCKKSGIMIKVCTYDILFQMIISYKIMVKYYQRPTDI